MRGGHAKLTVLAEISGPSAGQARVWSLRRADFEAMQSLLGELRSHRALALTGYERFHGAVALASAASASGRRTMLLECDLSRPRLTAELGLQPGPGLHEYLRWEATAAQILQSLALGGPAAAGAAAPLVCVSAGVPAADPATLLGSQSFRHAVAKLRRAYDLVILIAPPPITDRWALDAVAETADALLACVPPAQAEGREGRQLRAVLQRLAPPVLGALVVGGEA